MSFDWKKTVSTLAPGIATAIGSPVAGLAVKALCSVFGLDDSSDGVEQQLEQAVQRMTPEQALQLKAQEKQFLLDMEQLGVDVFKLEVDDRKSARKMYEKAGKAPQLILGVLIVLGVAAIIYAVIMGLVPSGVDATIVGTILGFAISEFRQLTGFFFGSSMGSKDKTTALTAAIQGGSK